MRNWEKIKQLQIFKQRPFQVLFGIELFLLILGIAGLFGKDAVYEYGPEHMVILSGTRGEDGSVCVDGQSGVRGNAVEFTGIALPRGLYQVELYYDTDVDFVHVCTVTDDVIGTKNIRTNGTTLFSGLDHTAFEMWLLRNSENTVVHAGYGGEGSMTVKGLTIRQTNGLNRIFLFVMLCVFTLINAGCLYVKYDKVYSIPAKNKTITFLLGLTIAFASIPLMVDYELSAGDLGYHLMRVEGIVDGIRAGQFPVRISPEWQQGYGYASPIFYGETVLYLAALFRLIGFSVTTAYRLFMFAVVAATALTAYFCFRKIFEEPYVGVFCSMLYSLSIYRIYKTWLCGSWGECFGIMFLPLVVYGFWRVFTQDVREVSYKRSWLPLTIGFSMLIQSHLLSGELAGGFTIILCLVLWRKVFRPQTFCVLAKAVVYSLLLSAWFLIPFADYMMTGDFVIQHVSGRTIQYRGLYPAHLFLTYFIDGGTVFFDQQGMYDSAPTGVGIAPVIALLILAYLFFAGKMDARRKEEKAFGKIVGWFSVLAMIMSLSLFPWDRIQSLNDITATLVSSIQFPNRFLTIANVCLTAAAGIVAKYVLEQKDRLFAAAYFGGMVFLVACGSIYLTDHALHFSEPVRIYNSEGMGTGYISGGEYLPYGAHPEQFVYHDPVCTEGVLSEDYEKKSLGAQVRLINSSEADKEAAFPLLYYKGYHAYAGGKELDCYAGNNFEVTVKIPAGFEGMVEVRFVSPWYWRAGEIVSLVTLLGMIVFCRRKRLA